MVISGSLSSWIDKHYQLIPINSFRGERRVYCLLDLNNSIGRSGILDGVEQDQEKEEEMIATQVAFLENLFRVGNFIPLIYVDIRYKYQYDIGPFS